MNQAIYGLYGQSQHAEVATLGRCLAHRASTELIWSPTPPLWLGWRIPERSGADTAALAPLVFTGALTNRAQLAASLGRPLGVPAPLADASLLWALYERFGVQAFSRISGQFAIALVEPGSATLVLAVDAWATQPLYFCELEGRWAFATEYKALAALRAGNCKIDPTTAGVLQSTKYLPPRYGLLAGVQPVAPGEYVPINANGAECASYGPLQLDVVRGKSVDFHAKDLRDTLLDATERLTEGVDRIGIALSAGLDSTLTLGAVRKVAPRKTIHTYTVSFNRKDPDLALAAESASFFGSVHREIIIEPEELPQLLPELVWRMEDPVGREEMLAYLVLSKIAACEVPLVIYGHLSDVLFGGMPRHLLIKAAHELPFLRGAITSFYDYTQTGTAPRSLIGRLLVLAYYRGQQTAPPQVAGACPNAVGKHLELAAVDPLNSALLAALQSPTEVAAMERLHAWAGVHFGSIFHDMEVARCAFRIPDHLKIRGRCRKYILRCAAEGILPSSFAARPKGMIRIARDRRLTRIIDKLAANLLSPEAVTARGLFRAEDVARLRRQRFDGTYSQDQFYHLWTLLLLELWCRSFVDSHSLETESARTLDRLIV